MTFWEHCRPSASAKSIVAGGSGIGDVLELLHPASAMTLAQRAPRMLGAYAWPARGAPHAPVDSRRGDQPRPHNGGCYVLSMCWVGGVIATLLGLVALTGCSQRDERVVSGGGSVVPEVLTPLVIPEAATSCATQNARRRSSAVGTFLGSTLDLEKMTRCGGELLVCCLAFLAGCVRAAATTTPTPVEPDASREIAKVASVPEPSAPPPAPSASPAPQASVADAAPEDPVLQAARDAVHAWSDALDRHDPKALSNMYTECVYFYAGNGTGCVPRSRVLQVKGAALGARSTFRQEIVGDVEVLHEKEGPRLVARFLKRSGGEGKSSEVRARLVMWRERDGRFAIQEESDEPADSILAARKACEDAADAVVRDIPEVKRGLEDIERGAAQSNGRWVPGGLGPLYRENGDFDVSLGAHSAERYDSHFWYTVSRDARGIAHLSVQGLDVSPAAQQAVARACKR